MNIEVISALLREENVTIVSAYNGVEALEIMEKRIELVEKRLAPMFKIVLLDYSMPEMDGPTTAEEMWKLYRKSSIITDEKLQPYICCCTSYEDEEYKSKAIAAGMNYFLTKPISYDILLQLLELLK